MKQFIPGFISGFTFALALAAGAASVTISTDSGQDARLAPAFGDKLGLGRNATAAEVKADLISYMRGVVLNYETEQAKKAIVQSPFSPN